MLRFIHKRASKQLSRPVCRTSLLGSKTEMLMPDCPGRAALQSQIDGALAAYQKKIQRLEALDMEADFANLFDQTEQCTPQLVNSYFERQIVDMEQAGKINTAIKYKATRTSLSKFHSAKLRFEDITLNYWTILKNSYKQRVINPILLQPSWVY